VAGAGGRGNELIMFQICNVKDTKIKNKPNGNVRGHACTYSVYKDRISSPTDMHNCGIKVTLQYN
jgi:hypothetical protein